MNSAISIPKEALSAFCREHGIRRLSLFGSAIHGDFGPDSDIDLLVEFADERVPGLFGIARMERELSALLGGRKVDLRTPEDLSRYFRQRILEEAQVQYAEGRKTRDEGREKTAGTARPTRDHAIRDTK